MVDPAMLLGLLPDGLATLDPTARTIVTAARTCFTERGFSNTTMQDIADAAASAWPPSTAASGTSETWCA